VSDDRWRTARADALDAEAQAIDDALTELDNVHAVLEAHRRTSLCTELRGVASALRGEAQTMRTEAGELRRTPDIDHRQMPAALTIRHARGAHR
jgi:hypothetical protein